MRTTLNLDDGVFDLARSLAGARRVSIGKALPGPAQPFDPEDVRTALDAEDAGLAAQFPRPSR